MLRSNAQCKPKPAGTERDQPPTASSCPPSTTAAVAASLAAGGEGPEGGAAAAEAGSHAAATAVATNASATATAGVRGGMGTAEGEAEEEESDLPSPESEIDYVGTLNKVCAAVASGYCLIQKALPFNRHAQVAGGPRGAWLLVLLVCWAASLHSCSLVHCTHAPSCTAPMHPYALHPCTPMHCTHAGVAGGHPRARLDPSAQGLPRKVCPCLG